MKSKAITVALCAGLAGLAPLAAQASSHREAPFITTMPKVDGTDFYMFRSYEPGRSNYVTFLANYQPLQNPTGGPEYYTLDPNAIYEISVDENGDAKEDITFQFKFSNKGQGLTVPSGGKSIPIPLVEAGSFGKGNTKNLNRIQTYTVNVIRGDRRQGNGQLATNVTTGGTTFTKPEDNIGFKSVSDYQAYAQAHIYPISIPGCSTDGRVFVGQRKDGFVVNLGETFDLVNYNPLGSRDFAPNTLEANVDSIAIEVPISCVTNGKNPIIGAWTTSSLRQARILNPSPKGSAITSSTNDKGPSVNGGAYVQVSRLSAPLVNELVIGRPDKNRFNASEPINDAQFLTYVINPSLPVLLNVLFPQAKVPGTPRKDLVAAFLTGIKGLNQPAGVTPAEMMRLNTSIPPTPAAEQNDLGVLGGDKAGFPNGRRPYDDVVDIELRVAEGALCSAATPCGSETKDSNNGAPFTDGARAAGPDKANLHVTGNINPHDYYLDTFPYLLQPYPGSPNGKNGYPADQQP
jgi:hypothetical protein